MPSLSLSPWAVDGPTPCLEQEAEITPPQLHDPDDKRRQDDEHHEHHRGIEKVDLVDLGEGNGNESKGGGESGN